MIDADPDDRHERRIGERGAHFVRQPHALLGHVGQAHQHVLQVARSLAGADHADEDLGEHLRVLLERFRQAHALVDAVAHAGDDGAERMAGRVAPAARRAPGRARFRSSGAWPVAAWRRRRRSTGSVRSPIRRPASGVGRSPASGPASTLRTWTRVARSFRRASASDSASTTPRCSPAGTVQGCVFESGQRRDSS